MKIEFLKNSALLALATAMVVTALPAQAAESDAGNWRFRADRAAEHQAERAQQPQRAEGNGGRSSYRPAPQAAPQAAQSIDPPQVAQREQRGGRGDGGGWRGNDGGGQRDGRQGGWQGRQQQGQPQPQWQERPRAQPQQPQTQQPQAQPGWRGDRGQGGEVRREDGQRWGQRGTDQRPGETRQWRGGEQRGDYRRDDRRDGNRGGTWSQNRDQYQYRDDRRGDHRQWNRTWRQDRRYDWNSYRRSNRSTFNLGIYYSPYRSYSYRRMGIGVVLQSLFYSNRYWINDPWQYRLPEVYGPYRWVRYYDDVLLVDIYSGEVVDVIYDFFW